MDLKNLESLSFFYPEIILSSTILLLIVVDLFVRSQRTLETIAVIGCVGSLWPPLIFTAPSRAGFSIA